VHATDPGADGLVAGEHAKRPKVEVVSKRSVDVLAETVDIRGRQTRR